MRTTKAIAIGLSIAWISVAAQTKATSDTVVTTSYQCGDFSALLVDHGDSSSGKPDDVLFVVRSSNLIRRAQNYTLVQVSPNIADIANARSHVAMYRRLRSRWLPDGRQDGRQWIGCARLSQFAAFRPCCGSMRVVETQGPAGKQVQRVNVSAGSLDRVRSALANASGSLQGAANQSDYVQNAIAVIDQALDDTEQASAHVHDVSGVRPPLARPNFDAPPPPTRGTTLMLYSSLNSLKSANDALNRIPGGDFAGYRVRLNNDITTAAGVLVNGIALYNARHP